MKKLMIFLTIFIFPWIVCAKEFNIEEVNLNIKANDDYIVLTRNNLENNSDLTKLGIPKDSLEEIMKKNNIYADILDSNVKYEILVVVPETKLGFNNLSNATDSMLEDLKKELVKKTGAPVSSVYKSDYNFIVIDYYDDNTKYYIVNYYTVVNARGYNFQLQKKTEITDEERGELKKIVDNSKIKILDEYKKEEKETQKQIDNYGKKGINYKNIILGAIIGAVVGLISYVINLVVKKKKSSV